MRETNGTCPFCQGNGDWKGEVCTHCDGDGVDVMSCRECHELMEVAPSLMSDDYCLECHNDECKLNGIEQFPTTEVGWQG